MIEAVNGFIADHPAHHDVHGVQRGRDGDNRDAAQQKQQVQLNQRTAFNRQDFRKAVPSGFLRLVRADARPGLGVIFLKKHVRLLFAAVPIGNEYSLSQPAAPAQP